MSKLTASEAVLADLRSHEDTVRLLVDEENRFQSLQRPHDLANALTHTRHGRGRRKNKAYWNARKNDEDWVSIITQRLPSLSLIDIQNPYANESLFDSGDGSLTVSASSYMASECDVSRCMSMKMHRTPGTTRLDVNQIFGLRPCQHQRLTHENERARAKCILSHQRILPHFPRRLQCL